jgi:hypothetical protein
MMDCPAVRIWIQPRDVVGGSTAFPMPGSCVQLLLGMIMCIGCLTKTSQILTPISSLTMFTKYGISPAIVFGLTWLFGMLVVTIYLTQFKAIP